MNSSKWTVVALTLSASALALSACAQVTSGIETTDAVCEAWDGALIDPSRSDTMETAEALTELRLRHEAACGG